MRRRTIGIDRTQAGEPARLRQLSFRALPWLALLLVSTAAVATNVGEAKKIVTELRSANLGFVSAAAGIEALFVTNLALFYTATFRATGVRVSLRRFFFVTSAAYFVNLVSKTGGLGGIALYLREARGSGESAARVSAAYMMVFVLGYAAYFIVLALSLALLYLRGSLTGAEIGASGVIMTIIIVVGAIMALGLRSQEALERLYLLAGKPINVVARFLRREPFVRRESAHDTTTDLYGAVTQVRRHPARYVVPSLHALAVELLAAAMLYLVARSLGANISLAQALAAYAISLLFSMIAITPAGLGFVEVSLSVLLISFGVPKQNAIAAALGYRLFEFWLPVLLGAISLTVLHFIQRDIKTA